MKASEVKEGDFFILSPGKGYSPIQREEAMQVMETYDRVMTVRCQGGCTVIEYDHIEKIEDISSCKKVHYSTYYEDHRTKLS